MPVFHDYECKCGHLIEDEMSVSYKDIKDSGECPRCGDQAQKHLGGFNNMVRWNFSSSERGYNKGFPDPQTGVEYSSYGHRQKVLRDQGLEDVGRPQSRDHIMADAESARNAQAEAQSGHSDVIIADSEEEITNLIDKDRVDWKETGNLDRDIDDGPGF